MDKVTQPLEKRYPGAVNGLGYMDTPVWVDRKTFTRAGGFMASVAVLCSMTAARAICLKGSVTVFGHPH